MADSDGAVGDLDRRYGLGAGADAINKVLLVVVTFVEANFAGANYRIQKRFGVGVEAVSSVYVDPSFGSYEADALAQLVGVGDDKSEALCKSASDSVAIGDVPEPASTKNNLFGLNLHGAGVLSVHSPLGDVEMVCAPVGDDSAGVVVVPSPAERNAALFGVGRPRCGAQPQVVIESFGDGLDRLRQTGLLPSCR